MGKRSKDKGDRGERELAQWLREHGCPSAYRVIGQRREGHENPDIEAQELEYAIECKRANAVNPLTALAKGYAEAEMRGDPRHAVVFTKRDHEDWTLTIDAAEFMRIYHAAVAFAVLQGARQTMPIQEVN